jgi:hypothetical protein
MISGSLPNSMEQSKDFEVLKASHLPLASGMYATGPASESGKDACRRASNPRPVERLGIGNPPNHTTTGKASWSLLKMIPPVREQKEHIDINLVGRLFTASNRWLPRYLALACVVLC